MSNRSVVPLGEVATVQGGFAFKSEDFKDTGIGVLKIKNVRQWEVDTNELAYVDEATAIKAKRFFCNTGDVLISMTGSGPQAPASVVGRVARFTGPNGKYLINQRVGRLVSKSPAVIDLRYLFYVLVQPEMVSQLVSIATGSANQANISGKQVEALLIPYVPIVEQRAIAELLGSLDDKIEQNRRTSQALEGLARATFKAWFVDFEPVKAKAAGQTSFPGMSPATFTNLPDRLTDSSLGPVPEGWDVTPLSEAFDVNPPRRLAKGVDAPYLDMKNMPTNGHAPDAWERRPHGSGMKFINGDTLVARITPCLENGKTAYVDFLNNDEVAWGSTEYIVLRPKPPLPSIFAYCLARMEPFRDFAIQNMSGTSGRQRVAASAMAHYHVAVPDTATARAFGDTVIPLFQYVRASKTESSKLAELRDYLLPQLLSGKVRVRDEERAAEVL